MTHNGQTHANALTASQKPSNGSEPFKKGLYVATSSISSWSYAGEYLLAMICL
jgi:hypothetical protein